VKHNQFNRKKKDFLPAGLISSPPNPLEENKTSVTSYRKISAPEKL